MTNPVFGQMLAQVYRSLAQDTVDSVVTGTPTSTTILDSSLVGRFNDTTFVNGVIFDEFDWEFKKITQYQNNVSGASVFTWVGAMARTPVAGDKYSAIKSQMYPLETMIKLFNDALQYLRKIPLQDVSLTTTSNTLGYTLPIAVKGKPIDRVEIQGYVTDQFNKIDDWEVDSSAPGATNTLYFRTYYPVGKTIKIWYRDIHPPVALYNDYISEVLVANPYLIKRAVDIVALEWRSIKEKHGNPATETSLNQMRQLFEAARLDARLEMPIRTPKFLPLGNANVRR